MVVTRQQWICSANNLPDLKNSWSSRVVNTDSKCSCSENAALLNIGWQRTDLNFQFIKFWWHHIKNCNVPSLGNRGSSSQTEILMCWWTFTWSHWSSSIRLTFLLLNFFFSVFYISTWSHRAEVVSDCSTQWEQLLIFLFSTLSSVSSVSAGHCSHRSRYHAVRSPLPPPALSSQFSQHTHRPCSDLALVLILATVFILVWLYYRMLRRHVAERKLRHSPEIYYKHAVLTVKYHWFHLWCLSKFIHIESKPDR